MFGLLQGCDGFTFITFLFVVTKQLKQKKQLKEGRVYSGSWLDAEEGIAAEEGS